MRGIGSGAGDGGTGCGGCGLGNDFMDAYLKTLFIFVFAIGPQLGFFTLLTNHLLVGSAAGMLDLTS